jgi:transposase
LKAKQEPEPVAYKQECLLEIHQLEEQGHVEVFYGDESGFCLTPVMSYSWQYPGEEIRLFPQKGKRVNVFGIMNEDNRLSSFAKEGSINTDFIIESIEKWMPTLHKPTVLILDNAPVHQAKKLGEKIPGWQEKDLFIFFLPAYCPHFNKIETLWRKVKYEWLKPENYTSLTVLKEALTYIFNQFGQEYGIKFA